MEEFFTTFFKSLIGGVIGSFIGVSLVIIVKDGFKMYFEFLGYLLSGKK
jgi:hypothetical protein